MSLISQNGLESNSTLVSGNKKKKVCYFNYSLKMSSLTKWGLPDSSVGKESVCNAGDPGLIPGSGRCPGEGKSCPL